MAFELRQFIRALDVFVAKHEIIGSLTVLISCFFAVMAIFGFMVYIAG